MANDKVTGVSTTKRVFLRFLIFGLMGLVFEVLLGAVMKAWSGDWNMRGGSSPWMIFDYGLLGVLLMPIAHPLKRRKIPLIFRAFVYMVVIFVVEFISGWIFELVGLRIWDNSHLPYNLCGYIAAAYIPVWYAIGLVAEYLYVRVDATAVMLLKGLKAEDILKS